MQELQNLETNTRNEATLFEVKEPANLFPIEIWDGIADGVTLFKKGHQPDSLIRFLEDLHQGKAKFTTRKEYNFHSSAANFDRLIFTGGGALSQGISNIRSSLFEVVIKKDPQWAGIEGLSKESLSFQKPLLIDWGQSCIKLSFQSEREIIPRDVGNFPILHPESSSIKDQSKLRRYYLDLISKFNADSVFLSLPVEIKSSRIAGKCSIPGLGYDLKQLFGTQDLPVTIFNDAVSASCSWNFLDRNIKTLVVTLGVAVGGCLFQPR